MLKVSIEVRSQVEITEIVSYDSTICHRNFKETIILKEDKLELRIEILQCQIFPKQERRRRGSNPRSPDK